jgi:hypothetical protein
MASQDEDMDTVENENDNDDFQRPQRIRRARHYLGDTQSPPQGQ